MIPILHREVITSTLSKSGETAAQLGIVAFSEVASLEIGDALGFDC